MRLIMRLTLGAAIVITALEPDTARSAPAFTTKYSYYSVSGESTTGIFASLLKRSLRVNGRRHHAITSIDISRSRTLRSAQGCSVGGLSVRFHIRLPKLDSAASLSANDRRLWQQFSTFVKRHEETHRAIWMGCVRSAEARIAGLQGRSCGEVESKARRVIEQAKIACRKKDVAFDAAEQSRLENHPFMKAAVAPIYAAPNPRLAAKKR